MNHVPARPILRFAAMRLAAMLIAAMFLVASSCIAQQQGFDTEAYRAWLAAHQNLGSSGLLQEHAAPLFQRRVAPSPVRYLDSVIAKYNLTKEEQALLAENGFVVTERRPAESFGSIYAEVWQNDLPVFVSTDAILHAVHMSYDAVLKETEFRYLISRLDAMLVSLHTAGLPQLQQRYASLPAMTPMLRDADLYLTVARRLLKPGTVAPLYPENEAPARELISLIGDEQPADYPLFSGVARTIDFSQFTVRGHYTQDPELGRYFRAMIWLGRTELMLSKPVQEGPQQRNEDIQRQIIDSYLLCEALSLDGAETSLEDIDRTLTFLVGESDNVRPEHMEALRRETGFAAASDLLDTTMVALFQQNLAAKPFAEQRINSQILMSDPMNPEQLKPPSAFLLLGQRFIIDSYVFGNVVYDRIIYNGAKMMRMLPSPMDPLFALGNDGAAQLLLSELDQYHYASQLGALRYLVDSYSDDFWNASLYNAWLNSIRALNPPEAIEQLPVFMQTAAWQQEKMNTQLASWAQLRHDNLLYAKQSYTGGATCSFPEGYVEPYPEFYRRIAVFARRAAQEFGSITELDGVVAYFTRLGGTADTLGIIAEKELAGSQLAPEESAFLLRMLFLRGAGCAVMMDGWYPKLFFNDDIGEFNAVIADVHTAPTDAAGNMVGWVLHAGTGKVNLGVVAVPSAQGGLVACVGAMLSYHQTVTTNFKRLTDEEWKTGVIAGGLARPDWTNVYLADARGARRPEGPVLATATPPASVAPSAAASGLELKPAYPNPLSGNGEAMISFRVSSASAPVTVQVYDAMGRCVRTLLEQPLPGGHYLAKWDARNDAGTTVPAGMYMVRVSNGVSTVTERLLLMK